MSNHESKSLKKNRNTRTLGVEHLEARLMNTLSTLEQSLQLLGQSPNLGSTQLVSNSLSNVNSTPRFASQPAQVVRGEVRTTSTQLTVLGADDQSERNLRYTWSVVSQPAGANATFSNNNNNSAKKVAISFNAAGDYTFQVTITDAQNASTSTTVQVRVAEVLRRIVVTSSDNRNLSNNGNFSVTGQTVQFNAVGFNQFGTAMSSQPSFSFGLTRPVGGSASNIVSGNSATITFNRAGVYALTVRSGALSIASNLKVTSNASTIAVTNNNQTLDANTPVAVTTTGTAFRISVADQFGQALRTQPRPSWSLVSGPSGANPRFTISNTNTNVVFDRAGSYVLRVQAGGITRNVTVNVTATLSSLTATSSTTSINIRETAQFQVTGRDQFRKRDILGKCHLVYDFGHDQQYRITHGRKHWWHGYSDGFFWQCFHFRHDYDRCTCCT